MLLWKLVNKLLLSSASFIIKLQQVWFLKTSFIVAALTTSVAQLTSCDNTHRIFSCMVSIYSHEFHHTHVLWCYDATRVQRVHTCMQIWSVQFLVLLKVINCIQNIWLKVYTHAKLFYWFFHPHMYLFV